MANLCDVEMTAYGKAEGLEKLAKLIADNDGIMYKMVESVDKNATRKIVCRGTFYMTDLDGMLMEIEENTDDEGNSSFNCDYEGAWTAQDDVHDFLTQHFSEYNLSLSYREIECGCGVYATNDSERYPEKWYLETDMHGAVDSDVCMDIQNVAKKLADKCIIGKGVIASDKDYSEMNNIKKEQYLYGLEEYVKETVERFNKNMDGECYITLNEIEFV